MIRYSPNPNRSHLIHWFEWGEAAFRAAREQNKPMMLFLSAFWCRYCQRMDEQAFSDTENIALLRAYFIPVRAENAQRPDLDVRYNQNGWPTIVFMTPRGEPIAAANYLPSDQFQDILLRVYLGHQQQQEEPRGVEAGPPQHEAARAAFSSRAPLTESIVTEIAGAIMEAADRVHGGYGSGQKFIQPEPSDFLLGLYERTRRTEYLDHVCLTLDRMREGAIRDQVAGGYFRTSTGPDWNQPHREKLLAEQAGLIVNCLRTYRITQRAVYAAMAEDMIGFLNAKLFDDSTGAFYGCEDFLRVEGEEQTPRDEFFTILDQCVYTDANALAVIAYLDGAELLSKADCQDRALRALGFLWQQCRSDDARMFHNYDGERRVPGLLKDQVLMGTASLRAFRATQEPQYLEWAKKLADFVLAKLKNPAGGYFDISEPGTAYLAVRLTLIEQNGPAASFFLKLAEATESPGYREAALWALRAFAEDAGSHGIYAAGYGAALAGYLDADGAAGF